MQQTNTRLFTVISLICLLCAVCMLGVWWYFFDPSTTSSIKSFGGYIPGISENSTISTVISMLLYGGAILFAILGDNTTTNTRKGVHFWVIVVAVCLLILNGYSLIR